MGNKRYVHALNLRSMGDTRLVPTDKTFRKSG